MREGERKWKKVGTAERFKPKNLINDPVSQLQCSMELIYCHRYAKLQKYMNWPLLYEGKFRKTPKIVQKDQTGQKGGGQFCSAAKICSPAKFRNLLKFYRGCEISHPLRNSKGFDFTLRLLFFFCLLICSSEFNLDSS